MLQRLNLNLPESTRALLDFTFYYTLLDSILHASMAQFESTWIYQGSTWLYFLLHSTWLYITLLLWLYLTLLEYTILYHSSLWSYTWLYYVCTTMALLHSTIALCDLTWLYTTLPWLHFNLLGSTTLYHSSTWSYLTLLDPTTLYQGSHSTWFYHGST